MLGSSGRLGKLELTAFARALEPVGWHQILQLCYSAQNINTRIKESAFQAAHPHCDRTFSSQDVQPLHCVKGCCSPISRNLSSQSCKENRNKDDGFQGRYCWCFEKTCPTGSRHLDLMQALVLFLGPLSHWAL